MRAYARVRTACERMRSDPRRLCTELLIEKSAHGQQRGVPGAVQCPPAPAEAAAMHTTARAARRGPDTSTPGRGSRPLLWAHSTQHARPIDSSTMPSQQELISPPATRSRNSRAPVSTAAASTNGHFEHVIEQIEHSGQREKNRGVSMHDGALAPPAAPRVRRAQPCPPPPASGRCCQPL